MQPEKAELPIEVTEFGITKSPVIPLQFSKAPLPIEITEFGISTVDIPLQLINAQFGMVCTPSATINSDREEQPFNQ